MAISLHRSIQKLSEAEFFLDRLAATRGKHPEFGYMLSAFLSAFRSIGYVLQKELRPQFRERFDCWWEAVKAQLPKSRVPFHVINELRNQALKEGELLPGMVIVAKVKHDAIDEVQFTISTRCGQIKVEKEQYTFRLAAVPTSALQNPNNAEEVRKEVEASVIPGLVDLFQRVNREQPDFEVSRIEYLLDDLDSTAVDFDQMVTDLKEHVTAMAGLLARAELEFPTKSA